MEASEECPNGIAGVNKQQSDGLPNCRLKNNP
jgi:hypothetical protein